MCRKPIYFKGMKVKISEWEDERIDNMFQNIFAESFEHVFDTHEENDGFSTMFCMISVLLIEERLNKLRTLGNWLTDSVDDEYIDLMVNDFETPIIICKMPSVYQHIMIFSSPKISHHKNTTRKITGFRKSRKNSNSSNYPEEVLELIFIF